MKTLVLGSLVALGLLACGVQESLIGTDVVSVSSNGATAQEIADCCQRYATIAQYQNNAANFQVGRCVTDGKAAYERGASDYAAWKNAVCGVSDATLVNGGNGSSASGSSTSGGSTGSAQANAPAPAADGGAASAPGSGATSAPDGGATSAPVSLQGTVYAMGTSPQRPLAGATVEVSRTAAAGAQLVTQATTDSSGVYTVRGLALGTYVVHVSEPNSNTAELTGVTVTSVTTAKTLDLQLSPLLSLTPVCSFAPATTRRWRVTNPLAVPVVGWWEAVGSRSSGRLSFPAGDSYFTTPVAGTLVRVTISGAQVSVGTALATACPAGAVNTPAATATTAATACDVLQPGTGSQACYQPASGGHCGEVRYDCGCAAGTLDTDPWRPGDCQAD